METRRRGQPKQRVIPPQFKGGIKEADSEVYEGDNMYPDLQNVWSRSAFTDTRANGKWWKSILLILGFLALALLMLQNIWLLQDYSHRTRPVEIREKEIVIRESESTRDLINYAANYNKAKIIINETTTSALKPLYPIFKLENSPDSALSDENNPGHCWAFQGDKGFITILLKEAIYPRHFSIIHATLAEHDTAPKNFCIYSASGSQTLLGCYEFDLGVKLNAFKQTFPCQSNCEVPAKKYRLVIDSNYGSDKTCLYQIQIHGNPHSLTI